MWVNYRLAIKCTIRGTMDEITQKTYQIEVEDIQKMFNGATLLISNSNLNLKNQRLKENQRH